MSFGFSASDVLLLSQLSYSIYQSITSGRKNASRALTELVDVLFSLRCALDHLQHGIEAIATASDASDPHAWRTVETREKLGLMLQNCADTLEDLDNATRKYRDGVNKGTFTPEEKSTLTRTARLKRRLASTVMKVRWDMDEEIVRSYRSKISSHVDAINLLLSSIMWSTTNDIHARGRLHSNQLAELQAKVSVENAALAKLVGDIHRAVTGNNVAIRDETAMTETKINSQGTSQEMVVKTPSSGEPTIAARHSFRPGPGIAMLALTGPDAEFKPQSAKTNFGASIPLRSRRAEQVPVPNLPPAVVRLNAERKKNVQQSMPRLKSTPVPIPPERPVCMTAAEASISELVQGLQYLLRSDVNFKPNLDKDVTTWLRLFENAIDSSSTILTSTERTIELVDLLICLNDELDKARSETRRLFYNASIAARVDDTFATLVRLSRSVRIEKEIDDFKDTREDWLGSAIIP